MTITSIRSRALGLVIASLAMSSFAIEAPEIEQTLITANRVTEDGARSSLSWNGIDGDAIATTAAVHINELMQRSPATWIGRVNGQEHLTALRSPILTGAGSCGAFYMAADGISLRSPGFCNVNQLFESHFEQAARVEVIKGPGTALYGTNALHGVINVLSARSPSSLEQQLSVEAGPHDYYRTRYRLGNTLGAHGFNIHITGTRDGGYRHNSGYDQQKLTLRHDFDGDTYNVVTVLAATNLNQETAGSVSGFEIYKDPALRTANPNPEAFRDARSWRLYSAFSRELGNHSTITLTPYLLESKMAFLQHFLPWQAEERNGHKSVGIRGMLQSDYNSLRVSSGLELEYTDGWLEEFQAEPFSPNQPAGVHYDYQVDGLLTAGFAQFTWSVGQVDIQGGVRLEHNRYDYDNLTGTGSACSVEASNCRFFRPADRRDDFTSSNFNLGANWQYADNHRLYGRFARGFRAPQVSELYRLQSGQQVADLDPVEIDSLEFGLRGNAIDRLEYDLSLWWMDKSEVIFQDANRQNVSGADTRHLGVDVSVNVRFSQHWYGDAAFSWGRHTYESNFALLGSSGLIEGNDIDTAPRLFGSARVGWLASDRPTLLNRAELELVYLGEHYLEPDNNHEYGGHTLLNLRLQRDLGPRLGAAVRVTNLLDTEYAERADFGFGNYRYWVGEPRGIYLQLTADL